MLPKIFKPFKPNINNLIRIGPKKDGGYVIDKRVIKKTKKIICCGLNDDWKFEKEFLKINPKCKIIAYDHTVHKEFWVKRFKKDLISLFLFKKLRLEKILDVFRYIDYLSFFKDGNKHLIKKVVNCERKKNEISIKNILKNQSNLILKIDIEEDEYNILDEICRHKFKCIVIEFSELKKNFYKVQRFIRKLELLGIYIIHIHANNFDKNDKYDWPIHLEVTFANEIEIKKSKKNNLQYPIKNLDFPNNPLKKDIVLKFK